MDEMRMIRDLYGTPAPPPQGEVAGGRARLDALATPRASTRRRGRRWLFVPALVPATAAVAAVALLVGTSGQDPQRPRPGAPVPLGGNSVLLTAADRAESAPTGQYWYSDQVEAQSYLVKGGYAISGASNEYFLWTAVKAADGSRYYGRDLPARPPTTEDEAAWRKAGSPSSFRVWSNDHYGTYTTSAGNWSADKSRTGGRFFLPGATPEKGMTAEQLQNLPTDPAALAKLIFASPPSTKRADPALTAWTHDAAHMVLTAQQAFGNAPLPPKVRAGLMRALAVQPGMRSFGTVTDALGRRGIAIGADWSAVKPDTGAAAAKKALAARKQGRPVTVSWTKAPYISREELIFDQATGAYLGEQKVLVKPGGEYRTRKPGFVINYWLTRGSGWTDKKPSPPRALPFS